MGKVKGNDHLSGNIILTPKYNDLKFQRKNGVHSKKLCL
jgi:hypothetical protein